MKCQSESWAFSLTMRCCNHLVVITSNKWWKFYCDLKLFIFFCLARYLITLVFRDHGPIHTQIQNNPCNSWCTNFGPTVYVVYWSESNQHFFCLCLQWGKVTFNLFVCCTVSMLLSLLDISTSQYLQLILTGTAQASQKLKNKLIE